MSNEEKVVKEVTIAVERRARRTSHAKWSCSNKQYRILLIFTSNINFSGPNGCPRKESLPYPGYAKTPQSQFSRSLPMCFSLSVPSHPSPLELPVFWLCSRYSLSGAITTRRRLPKQRIPRLLHLFSHHPLLLPNAISAHTSVVNPNIEREKSV
jgi:hypothetical protein